MKENIETIDLIRLLGAVIDHFFIAVDIPAFSYAGLFRIV